MAAEYSEAMVHRIVARIRRRLRQDLARGINRPEVNTDELTLLLVNHEYERIATLLSDWGQRFADGFSMSFLAAGRDLGEFIRRNLRLRVSFDSTNPRAVRQMRRNRLQFIREITDEQRRIVRQVVTTGVRQGINPREMARELRQSIGLTAHQQRIVANYERQLRSIGTQDDELAAILNRRLRDRRFDPSLLRAQREGARLTEDQIRQMVNRYRQRWVNFRSETIARTEALRAAHEGNEEMLRQAIESREISAEGITRTWVAAQDGRTRESHANLSGQVRALGEPFKPGLRYPCDPNAPADEVVRCRCVLATRLDPAA